MCDNDIIMHGPRTVKTHIIEIEIMFRRVAQNVSETSYVLPKQHNIRTNKQTNELIIKYSYKIHLYNARMSSQMFNGRKS